MQHDPLNDAISSIKNAEHCGKIKVTVKPTSKLLARVLKVMQDFEYIKDFEYEENGRGGEFRIDLSGNINNCGVVKPRFSVRLTEIDRFEKRFLPAQDFGVLILTTTQGVLSHVTAKQLKTGGKLLAFVY